VPLYLLLANPDCAGPGVKRLAEIIRESVGPEDIFESVFNKVVDPLVTPAAFYQYKQP